jgi:hypothetical protein
LNLKNKGGEIRSSSPGPQLVKNSNFKSKISKTLQNIEQDIGFRKISKSTIARNGMKNSRKFKKLNLNEKFTCELKLKFNEQTFKKKYNFSNNQELFKNLVESLNRSLA